MKKIIIIAFLFLPFWANAQTECVLGLVNDPAPGSCGSYSDKDGNELCDLSEFDVAGEGSLSGQTGQIKVSEEELKQYSVGEVAGIYGISETIYAKELSDFLKADISGNDSMQALHDEKGLCAGVAATIASSLQGGSGGVESVDPNSLISGSEIKAMKIYEVAQVYGIAEEKLANEIAAELGIGIKQGEQIQVLHDNYGLEASRVKEIAAALVENNSVKITANSNVAPLVFGPRYRFLPIVLSLLFLYLITYILVLQKKMTVLTMRRFWNVLLLVSFALSALSGLLLVVRINYGLYVGLPFNILYWHVEFGTIMAVISIFHLSWHWQYYACMLGRGKKSECGKAK